MSNAWDVERMGCRTHGIVWDNLLKEWAQLRAYIMAITVFDPSEQQLVVAELA
jgi:hypothetical protein